MDWTDDQEVLGRAVAGEEEALDLLVTTLIPVIQKRVERCLGRWRRGPSAGRNVRQEVEDRTQDIFVDLFEGNAKVLRSWQPGRGLPLLRFVDLVAERQTISFLRSGRRNPWRDDPTRPEEMERASPGPDPENVAASREEWRLLERHLIEELSPLGRHLFELLFVKELSIPEMMAITGMTADAIYAWRSRLKKLARKILAEMRNQKPASPSEESQ